MSGGEARVLIYASAPDSDPAAVERAYHEISAGLDGTPGLLGNELLRDTADRTRFVVLSRWGDLAAFQAWESGPDHRGSTSPLRRYQKRDDPAVFGIYEVVASYG